MPDRPPSTTKILIASAVVVLAAALTTFRYGLVTGLAVAVVGSIIAWAGLALASHGARPEDPSRRRFLALSGLLGLVVALGGAEAGRYLRRWTRPDPEPATTERLRATLERLARGDDAPGVTPGLRAGINRGALARRLAALQSFTFVACQSGL